MTQPPPFGPPEGNDPYSPPAPGQPGVPGQTPSPAPGPAPTYPGYQAPPSQPYAGAPAPQPSPYETPGTPPAADATGYAAPPAAPYMTEPSTSVGWVIAGFLLFWPTGIPALFASQRAARALGAGDWATATTESARARKFGIISLCVYVGVLALSLIMWTILIATLGSIFEDSTYYSDF